VQRSYEPWIGSREYYEITSRLRTARIIRDDCQPFSPAHTAAEQYLIEVEGSMGKMVEAWWQRTRSPDPDPATGLPAAVPPLDEIIYNNIVQFADLQPN
jgi:hypothetical protein